MLHRGTFGLTHVRPHCDDALTAATNQHGGGGSPSPVLQVGNLQQEFLEEDAQNAAATRNLLFTDDEGRVELASHRILKAGGGNEDDYEDEDEDEKGYRLGSQPSSLDALLLDSKVGSKSHWSAPIRRLFPWYLPRRYVLAFVGFLGFMNVYALRAILSVAVVEMEIKFNYSTDEKGLLLASFFIGYLFLQIPGGWVASTFGAKWVLAGGMFIAGVFTLLLPMAAEVNIWVAMLTRVLVGFGEGVAYPSTHAMISKWAPPNERTRISSIIYSGAYFGTVVAFPSSTVLLHGVGWESIFYVFGGIAIGWVVLWLFIVSSSPAMHPTISDEERMYIIDNLPPEVSVSFRDIPWMKVLACLPFWALFINHTANNWTFYTLLTWLPTYMKSVLNFDIENAGFIAVLPYITLAAVQLISGFFADLCIACQWLGVTAVRKIWQTIGFSIAGVGLVACGYVESVPPAVTLMTISGGAVGFAVNGFQVNHLDIAPTYSGILMGITNCAATVPGIIAPFLTGVILGDDQTDIERWRIVFFISGGIYAFALGAWLLFASGKRQL